MALTSECPTCNSYYAKRLATIANCLYTTINDNKYATDFVSKLPVSVNANRIWLFLFLIGTLVNAPRLERSLVPSIFYYQSLNLSIYKTCACNCCFWFPEKNSLSLNHSSRSLNDRWGIKDDWVTTFLHSSLFEGLHPTLILSILVYCLSFSFSVCLSFSLPVPCPVGSSLQVLLISLYALTI